MTEIHKNGYVSIEEDYARRLAAQGLPEDLARRIGALAGAADADSVEDETTMVFFLTRLASLLTVMHLDEENFPGYGHDRLRQNLHRLHASSEPWRMSRAEYEAQTALVLRAAQTPTRSQIVLRYDGQRAEVGLAPFASSL